MVIIADKLGRTDSAYHTLVKHINSDIPIVMVSWEENFIFNPALIGIDKYVLVCFCEYGWDNKLLDTHVWGKNTEQFKRYSNHHDYLKFDEWVKGNPPVLTLKRELLKKDLSDILLPIEYPCVVANMGVSSKEQFDSRPINVFQYWGRSNENRLRIHGEIWLHSYVKGFQVCDNLYYLNSYMQEERGEKWVSLWIPHYARVEINGLMQVAALSKLSLSWAGAGFKCFRHMEAPVSSVMVMHYNDFAWTYDWDETNCILVDDGEEVFDIQDALNKQNLYDIYLEGVKNVNKYRLENYIPHLEKAIKDRI